MKFLILFIFALSNFLTSVHANTVTRDVVINGVITESTNPYRVGMKIMTVGESTLPMSKMEPINNVSYDYGGTSSNNPIIRNILNPIGGLLLLVLFGWLIVLAARKSSKNRPAPIDDEVLDP
ncbi:MAG: hypothetical protein V4576_03260 [Patescibacteria group bacterium]